MKSLVTILFVLLSFQLAARENIGAGKTSGSNGTQTTTANYKTAAADCDPGSSQFDLEINNVRTRLLNGGDLWWDLSDGKYEVPKIDPPGSAPSVHSLFAGSIWISGLDEGGNLKLAAQTYRQTGDDFWPGPISSNGTVEKQTCQIYDRHFNVFGSEIDDAKAAYLASGGVAAATDIADNVLLWPALGNPHLLNAEGLEIIEPMAPFFDNDQDGIYDPTKGDYPVIRSGSLNYGDQMVFWVYNDVGNIHTETNGEAIGLQVNALAFAFQTSDEVNNMTFYRYNLVNKSTNKLTQTYMGQWVDPDLGCFDNDYVGCDTSRSLGIVYNGTATDPDCSSLGYGDNPPLLGVDYFEGPFADLNNGVDDDKDGLIDEGSDGLDNNNNGVADDIDEREKLGMSSFIYYNNDFSQIGNPQTASHFRNYQTGFWKDGLPIEFGGNGYNQGTFPSKYMFTSNPSTGMGWSECTVGNEPADRRFLQNSGPFILEPGAEQNITVGVVWVQPPPGSYPCPDFNLIGAADDKAQALFDNDFKLVNGPDAPTLEITELDEEIIIEIKNLVGSNNENESYNEPDPILVAQQVSDTTFVFQGYLIYQLANATVTAQDLSDPSKAKLIAQYDLKDDVSTLINIDFDNETESDISTLMVEGNNLGIEHSFSVSQDAFAEGDISLVNYQNYYFAALAYAVNQYREVTLDSLPYIDPNDPVDSSTCVTTTIIDSAGNEITITECDPKVKYLVTENVDEQRKPFLQGRRNFKIYSAIPHKSNAIEGGTDLMAAFGDGTEVMRISGSGNGGNEIGVTQRMIDKILNAVDHKVDTLEYVVGMDPIGFKVTNPLALQEADFMLELVPDSSDTVGILSDNARWRITDLTDGRNYVINSDRDISRPNEQIITYSDGGVEIDYGFSVNVSKPQPVGVNDRAGNAPYYGYISSSVEYENNINRWLSFVVDEELGQESETNWIRSGENYPLEPSPSTTPSTPFYDNRNFTQEDEFTDPTEEYENILDKTFAPYCLTSNYSNTTGLIKFVYNPGFRWKKLVSITPGTADPLSNLEMMASVKIVITDDQEKWSRCIVFETGEDEVLNEENAFKGQIRMTNSIDINGNEMASDTGRSWFPGYAINKETGERLNICFGEASMFPDQNGSDMIWNPTSAYYTTFSTANTPLFGGMHFIYVMNSIYDEGEKMQHFMLDNFNKTVGSATNFALLPAFNKEIYRNILYTCMPYLGEDAEFRSMADGLIPADADISFDINVERPYNRYNTELTEDSLPRYFFSTRGIAPKHADEAFNESALDLIKVVPNPYYGYSGYETSQLDNRVKITNLPDQCTVTIWSLNGTMIRQFNRIVENTGSGTPIDIVNNSASLDWNLTNMQNIPVSSGVYMIHVEAEGFGEKTVKAFIGRRPTDVDSF